MTILRPLVDVKVPNPESGTDEPPFFPLPLSAITSTLPITDKRSVSIKKMIYDQLICAQNFNVDWRGYTQHYTYICMHIHWLQYTLKRQISV